MLHMHDRQLSVMMLGLIQARADVATQDLIVSLHHRRANALISSTNKFIDQGW